MLDQDCAAQFHNVFGAVVALSAFPAWAVGPIGLESFYLFASIHVVLRTLGWRCVNIGSSRGIVCLLANKFHSKNFTVLISQKRRK